MPDYSLAAESILAGYSQHFDGVGLTELTQRAVVSMAVPVAGQRALDQRLKERLGLALPDVGQWLSSEIENIQLLRLQQDQLFVLFDYSGDRAVEKFAQKFSEAYLSDQSDSWLMLRLDGTKSRDVLARICPIDLHPAIFPPGSVARTVMEHIATIIVCEVEHDYTLMAPRSYARSFLHALEASIDNI